MMLLAAPISIASAGLFCSLTLQTDRKRGAAMAQGALTLAAAIIFIAMSLSDGFLGVSAFDLAALATALMAASVAGMLYHLYLGRFTQVWAARGVFSLVFLGTAGLFGLVLLSLI